MSLPEAERPPARELERAGPLRLLGVLLAPTLAAYLLFDRAAAYFHIPGTPVYAAEALLAVGLVAWVRRPGPVWSAIRGDAVLCAVVAFFLWGILRAVPNVGAYGFTYTIRDSSLWYYSLFAVLVAATTLTWPGFPARLADQLVRFAPWLLVWLPFAVILGTSPGSPFKVPFSNVSVLSHKDGNVAVAAFLALLALSLWPNRGMSLRSRRGWSLVAIGVVLIAATQNRGGLVAIAAASAVGLVLIRGLARPAAKGVMAVAVLGVLVGLLLPHHTAHSARSVSPSQLVANVESLAGINKSNALQGTEQARQRQWSYVVRLEEAQGKTFYGWGPGPNLGFGQVTGTGDETLRVPHNSHVDVLARLGLIGLGLWIFAWLSWSWRLLVARKRLMEAGLDSPCRILEICFLTAIAILLNAFFDPSLEGGQVAVLLWTIFGVGAALSNPRWTRRLA